jgi:DNA mismatch repair protein MutS
MTTSPMMQQYADAKEACGDALLLFRMGDFYELFHDDAKTAARVLGLTLTSRDKGDNPIPMAGFPHHQLETYLGKLIKAGFRAAVCEQVEDPKAAKGLVRREVTRVVTPGTLTDDTLLDPKESNYLCALLVGSNKRRERLDEAGLAWCDLSTGRFFASVFPRDRIADQLARIAPSECLVPEDAEEANSFFTGTDPLKTRRPPWAFSWDGATASLTKHFGTAGLEGFGFLEEDRLAIRAAGAVLDYLRETQRTSLDHLDRLLPYRPTSSLEIDVATRRSLELTRTIREGRREGSLLAVLDRCVTNMGSRLLAEWLANPLTDQAAITARLDAVEEFSHSATLRRELKQTLSGVFDLERLIARVTTGRASPRDLRCVGRTLEQLPAVKEKLETLKCGLLVEMTAGLPLCADLRERLAAALVDECPMQVRDGGFIRAGYHDELDALRQLAVGGKQWIARYQAQEAERTGIPTLKVGYNKVFGYYIELTNAHRDKAPPDYHRKQTLKNAERYITPELKEYEEQVLTADERAKELEYQLFTELRDAVLAASRPADWPRAGTPGYPDLAGRSGSRTPLLPTEDRHRTVPGHCRRAASRAGHPRAGRDVRSQRYADRRG